MTDRFQWTKFSMPIERNLSVQADLVLLCFASLCFADTALFYKLKVCGNLASSKSIGAIFPTALARFLSLCYILVILAIFQTFSLLLCLLRDL